MIFKIIALFLLFVFYGCYFIKQVIQKKIGIKTFQIGNGKTGFVRGIECMLMISAIIVALVELISIVLGRTRFPCGVRILGIVIGAVGVTFFIVAAVTMHDSWRAGVSKSDKTELVITGIFSISRNPAFLGFDLLYLGILLMYFNWVLFAVSLFAAIMFHLQIVNVEEDFLFKTFGEDYLDYRKRVNRYWGKKKRHTLKSIMIPLVCVLIVIPLIILPVLSVIVYETVFGQRYETASWMQFSVTDYEGLKMERSDFQSEDVILAGYKYYKENQEVLGVVVIAHGLGGGGHNTYMPFIDYFTSNGYYVFAYDAQGNDNSGGDSVEGLPQGVICLDNALHHAASIADYQNLPFTLFGHSWGGYSVGNVLFWHPEIKAAVIIAGFNESRDLLEYQGKQIAGAGIQILLPYVEIYERMKFGKKYSAISAIEGLEKTDAGILIVHSKDDATVPTKYGYDKFYDTFSETDRFEFVLYEDKGHDYLFYSEAAWTYRQQLNDNYRAYVENNGRKYSSETKEEYMNNYLDKKRCFEPDSVLMEQIIDLFNTYCVNCSM